MFMLGMLKLLIIQRSVQPVERNSLKEKAITQTPRELKKIIVHFAEALSMVNLYKNKLTLQR